MISNGIPGCQAVFKQTLIGTEVSCERGCKNNQFGCLAYKEGGRPVDFPRAAKMMAEVICEKAVTVNYIEEDHIWAMKCEYCESKQLAAPGTISLAKEKFEHDETCIVLTAKKFL